METLRITVLHEYGAKNHYTALQYLCNEKKYDINYREFGIAPQIKTIIKKSKRNPTNALISNLFFLFRKTVFCSKKEIIILGIAPLDIRMILLLFILRHDTIFIHNSWPEWKDGNFPKNNSGIAKKIWMYAIKNKVSGFFAVSEKTRNGFLNYFHLNNKYKCEVVYHSVPDDCYANEEIILCKEKTKKILFIGRLVEAKGLRLVKEIASHLKDHTIHIIGDGPDKHLLADYGNIIMHGFISDRVEINSISDQCSFLLQPSLNVKGWQEAFGLTVLESMARGIPVIATKQPGPKEIIRDGQGFIFDEIQYINNAINIIEKLDLDTWKEVSMSAFRRSQDFSKNKLALKWSNLIDESLGR